MIRKFFKKVADDWKATSILRRIYFIVYTLIYFGAGTLAVIYTKHFSYLRNHVETFPMPESEIYASYIILCLTALLMLTVGLPSLNKKKGDK